MEGISAVYGSDGSFRLLALSSFDFIRGKGDWNDGKFAVFMGELSHLYREKPHMVFVFFFPFIYSFCREKRGTENLYLSADRRVPYDFQPGFPWGFD